MIDLIENAYWVRSRFGPLNMAQCAIFDKRCAAGPLRVSTAGTANVGR